MKILILLSVCVAAFAYTDVPNIDVDAVVKDPVETKKYLDCFLDKGPCTDAMTHIKGHINEAISNACAKCTPKEKHMAEEFIFNVATNYPEITPEVMQKFNLDKAKSSKIVQEISKY